MHFARNVWAHGPQWEREVVAAELQEVFVAKRRCTAESLTQGFVGVFPSEESQANMATVVMLRATEDWGFRRFMDMAPFWEAEQKRTNMGT
ncbi:MAG: hypothetical protein ACK42L_00060 [Thermoanaerobaculum sp.]